jgi:hypothetical protein
MSASPKLAPHGPLSLVLATLTAACLGVSGFIHLDLADSFSHNPSGTIKEDVIFRIQGVGVIVVALLVLTAAVFLKGKLSGLIFLVAALTMAGSVAAVLITRYYDPGTFLFLPDMYEPLWYTEKTVSLLVEALGTLFALGGAGAAFMAAGFLKKGASAGSAAG